jgi:hypothetical protein
MDLILFVIFLLTLGTALVPFFRKFKSGYEFRRVFNKIPGPPVYPIVGTILPYIRRKREGLVNSNSLMNSHDNLGHQIASPSQSNSPQSTGNTACTECGLEAKFPRFACRAVTLPKKSFDRVNTSRSLPLTT